ncbi:hypothetical protein SARC_00461 [Sphaeroforma arctica JP610]|uniref:Uncharacterized protein n=1 Tax=Sphaeroforma arctica JP610 TaxID=667725 RepID=A0A0L0GEW8_9EUKA|nr:hypothetical protein SARC_00461 [Sphaeroforma arctica JP610]KNC87424.1 hypothetical protein SARC_00461 [Sphaeroforma arctica JP610]|eukprot:XP_014161326.1 hypothetical protein SARC_00461 [Sphaeroforma arctica JP610]
MEMRDRVPSASKRECMNSKDAKPNRKLSCPATTNTPQNADYSCRRTLIESQQGKRKSRSVALLRATKSKVSKFFIASIGGPGDIFNYEPTLIRSEPSPDSSSNEVYDKQPNNVPDVSFRREYAHSSTPNLHRDKRLKPAASRVHTMMPRGNLRSTLSAPIRESVSIPNSSPCAECASKSFSRTGSGPPAVSERFYHNDKHPQAWSPKLRSALFRQLSIPSTPPTIDKVTEVADALEMEFENVTPRPRSWSLPNKMVQRTKIDRNFSDGSVMRVPQDWCVEGFERTTSRSMSIEPKLESCRESHEADIIEESPDTGEIEKEMASLKIDTFASENG